MTDPAAGEEAPAGGHFGARFEPPPGGVHVTVAPNTLNINTSNLTALERLAEHNPEVAKQLIEATRDVTTNATKRYVTGAVCATIIAAIMLLVSGLVIVLQGFLAGISFFLACVAVSAILGAFFTGKTESLSWTVNLVRGWGSSEKTPTE